MCATSSPFTPPFPNKFPPQEILKADIPVVPLHAQADEAAVAAAAAATAADSEANGEKEAETCADVPAPVGTLRVIAGSFEVRDLG